MNKTLLIITALMLIVGCSKKTDVKINGSTEKVTSSSQVSIKKDRRVLKELTRMKN